MKVNSFGSVHWWDGTIDLSLKGRKMQANNVWKVHWWQGKAVGCLKTLASHKYLY